jgi:hypothetical protein
MSMTAYELENEYEFELEGEFEGEYEYELEGELEGEEFIRRLAGLARSAASSPALRRVALTAARSALRGAGPVGSAVGGLLPQREFEFEGEFELEGEYEFEEEGFARINPVRRVYTDALMEHMGHAAAQAESEAEAEAFIGALIPLAARLIPQAASAVMRAAPQLIRGAAAVTRTLRSNPATRPLVQAIPSIVRGTAANLAGQVARGRPITAQSAVRALAGQTQRVLSTPQTAVRTVQRARKVDGRYHRAAPGGAPRALPAARQRRVSTCNCR